jgi:hypothetical protein
MAGIILPDLEIRLKNKQVKTKGYVHVYCVLDWDPPNIAAKGLALLLRIGKVPGSSLGLDTKYFD